MNDKVKIRTTKEMNELTYINTLKTVDSCINILFNMNEDTINKLFVGCNSASDVLRVTQMINIIDTIIKYQEKQNEEVRIGDELQLIKNPDYKTVVIFIDTFGNIKCLNKNFEFMIINPSQYHNWERSGNRVPYIIEAVKAIVNNEYMTDKEEVNY